MGIRLKKTIVFSFLLKKENYLVIFKGVKFKKKKENVWFLTTSLEIFLQIASQAYLSSDRSFL